MSGYLNAIGKKDSNESVFISLDEDTEEGGVDGYVTNARKDVQLKNYLEEHGCLEAAPLITSKYGIVSILRNIWVDEEYRNEGFGSELLNEFILNSELNDAEAIVLVADRTEENSMDIIKWYEGFDFEVIYGKDSDFPVMLRKSEI